MTLKLLISKLNIIPKTGGKLKANIWDYKHNIYTIKRKIMN